MSTVGVGRWFAVRFEMKGDCCGMFRALGVGTRVRILEVLKTEGPLGAKRIAELLGVTPAAVSQHLRVLREAGLVSSERKGYFIPYAIDPGALEKCGRAIFTVCGCMPDEHPGKDPGERKQSCRSEIESLESYRRELERQLEAVRDRLDSLKRKKA